MRIILFFDLPTLTSGQRKSYRIFVKEIIKIGFYRLQESVFCKMCVNLTNTQSVFSSIAKIKPKEGNIIAIVVTEHQFATMRIIFGEVNTDVITNFDRVIEL